MFDRTWTFGLLNGAGPDAQTQTLQKPDGAGTFYIEAWLSNFGSSNVHLLQSAVQLAECQGRLERGLNDFLMTVSGAAVCRRVLPDEVSVITVFFEAVNSSGQAQLVTVRVFGD